MGARKNFGTLLSFAYQESCARQLFQIRGSKLLLPIRSKQNMKSLAPRAVTQQCTPFFEVLGALISVFYGERGTHRTIICLDEFSSVSDEFSERPGPDVVVRQTSLTHVLRMSRFIGGNRVT